ncbi:MAG: gamma-glutamyl-gamma-aminobutyrate hydrolase family protein [Rhodospirillales bacterium]|nr:MAG: gamma-glutamyl-gamma-aminobutyrate hydrolase family protein [Rhodospirillales bacterium]
MTEHDLPLVGIPACVIAEGGGGDFHKVGEKYIMAVAGAAHCMPLLIPALGDWYDPRELAQRLDGLLLTGSPSNVEPHHYNGTASRPGTHHDPVRDATTLPLIRAALELGVPLFAICRGHQELNVALGGTLHQNVHEEDGKDDHRSDQTKPYDDRYRERHAIRITPGGVLQRLAGGATEVMVNSLHAQAIDRVADRLAVEAVSPDGVVEAVTVRDAQAFALSVQWHPEHPIALEWPLSQAMFRSFGDAARARRAGRSASGAGGGRTEAA